MNAERLLEHFDKISEAPDAIPRLRRFILDLAVRGKLVEQDPADKTASRLIPSRGVAMTGLAANADAPGPFKIPFSWSWQRLEDLTSKITDGEHATPPRTTDRQVPLVTAKNVREGQMDYTYTDWVSYETAYKAWQRCKPQPKDILLVCVGATTGRLCVLRDSKDMVLVRSVALIRPCDAILEDYLAVVLRSPMSQTQIWEKVKVAAQPCLYINRIKTLSVPLAPFGEQRRIVLKVEELMALCDELQSAREKREKRRDQLARTALYGLNTENVAEGPNEQPSFHASARFYLNHLPKMTARPEHVQQLRQTILNLAVRGKLVPQDPGDEPAGVLLERIFLNKRDLGFDVQDMRKKADLPDLAKSPPSIPISWEWIAYRDIVTEFRYGTSQKCEYGAEGQPVLRIPNISNGKITIDDLKYASLSDDEVQKLALLPGDILMIRSNGSLNLVGRPALVEDFVTGFCYAGYLVRARFAPETVCAEYVVLALNSRLTRDQIEIPIRSAVGLKNVNSTELGNLVFPLPPPAEQRRIVAKVDELISLCDELETRLQTGTDFQRSLLEVSLLDAFRERRA